MNNHNKGKEIQENFIGESHMHQLNDILKGLGSKSDAKTIDNQMQPLNNMMSISYIDKQEKKNKVRNILSNIKIKIKPTTLKIKEK